MKALQLVHKTVVLAFVVAGHALAASSAWAQVTAGEPDVSKAKVRLGPLLMSPTISLSNLGIDQNVFNDAPDRDPKQDFTATVTPATDLWLRLGPSWFTANIREDIIWYQKYSSERAANNSYKVGWRLPLSRLNVGTSLVYLSARDRVGSEIDARAPRKEFGYSGVVEARALTRTFVGVTGLRNKTTYDPAATFEGVNLDAELSHTTTGAGLVLRQQVTTLTTLNLTAIRSQDQFAGNSLRDSMSTTATASVSFDPEAAIKGGATVGYRDFEPTDARTARFTGAIVSADLTYVLFGSTRFAGHANRDVQYSYDVNQPYYVGTGFDGSIAQQLFGPFDIIGRIGTQRLEYTTRDGAVVAEPNRTDRVFSYGGGIGLHLNTDLRLGVNIDQIERTSVVATRQYSNLTIGTALTYGF